MSNRCSAVPHEPLSAFPTVVPEVYMTRSDTLGRTTPSLGLSSLLGSCEQVTEPIFVAVLRLPSGDVNGPDTQSGCEDYVTVDVTRL